MKLLRVGAAGAERPMVQDDDGTHYDIGSVTRDLDAEFLASDGIGRVREELRERRLPAVDIGDARIGAPIARPGVVLCIGQNYAAHAAESGGQPPETPIIFYKAPNTVVGPFDEVRLPRDATKVDWEVELGVVIGRTARYLDSPADAAACIAGYVVSDDVSERDFQLARSGGQWSKGKSCETFNPVGPWLVPASDVDAPQNLKLRSWVNGEPRQDSTTADMIFSVDYLVWHLSQFMVLDPGDLINTGTPEGVALSGRFPYLKPGDVVEIEIEGLGTQRTVTRTAP